MHLLVLGAFWRSSWGLSARCLCLNAPFGARCFMTWENVQGALSARAS
ncbi:hypothetical protein HMPREF0970_00538 [Schaalia odontolytica F0309]|uniref:Uncharacterized protein n=1 Tax=Schaalia odontolytica F0309 TaxID=649742 RepID=D4TX81_9ACTO|nr:hypothetical protein HMPREF0970_00538 [Schaalia odontolytica F0309]